MHKVWLKAVWPLQVDITIIPIDDRYKSILSNLLQIDRTVVLLHMYNALALIINKMFSCIVWQLHENCWQSFCYTDDTKEQLQSGSSYARVHVFVDCAYIDSMDAYIPTYRHKYIVGQRCISGWHLQRYVPIHMHTLFRLMHHMRMSLGLYIYSISLSGRGYTWPSYQGHTPHSLFLYNCISSVQNLWFGCGTSNSHHQNLWLTLLEAASSGPWCMSEVSHDTVQGQTSCIPVHRLHDKMFNESFRIRW